MSLTHSTTDCLLHHWPLYTGHRLCCWLTLLPLTVVLLYVLSMYFLSVTGKCCLYVSSLFRIWCLVLLCASSLCLCLVLFCASSLSLCLVLLLCVFFVSVLSFTLPLRLLSVFVFFPLLCFLPWNYEFILNDFYVMTYDKLCYELWIFALFWVIPHISCLYYFLCMCMLVNIFLYIHIILMSLVTISSHDLLSPFSFLFQVTSLTTLGPTICKKVVQV